MQTAFSGTFLTAFPGSYSFEPDTEKGTTQQTTVIYQVPCGQITIRGQVVGGIALVLSSDVDIVLCTRLMLHICGGTKVQDRCPLPFKSWGASWIWKFGELQGLSHLDRI